MKRLLLLIVGCCLLMNGRLSATITGIHFTSPSNNDCFVPGNNATFQWNIDGTPIFTPSYKLTIENFGVGGGNYENETVLKFAMVLVPEDSAGKQCNCTVTVNDWSPSNINCGSATDSININVLKVSISRIDASNPHEAEMVFSVLPDGAKADELVFTISSQIGNQKKQNVSGTSSFTFDQSSIIGADGDTILKIACKVGSQNWDVIAKGSATRKYKQSQEAITGYFLSEGVGLRLFPHTLGEATFHISYDVSYSGKTICTSGALASVNLVWKDFSIGQEQHRYDPLESNFEGMASTSVINPPGEYWNYWDLDKTIWYDSTNPSVKAGIAKCGVILYEADEGNVPGTLTNTEIDTALP